MSTNRISANLSQTDRDTIISAVETIRQKLPFLIELSPDERKTLPKFGDKSRTFVEKAFELAKQNPGFLPGNFDVDEMSRDLELFNGLSAILMGLNKLMEELEDTNRAAGSEAYVSALLIYNYAKAGGMATAGLDTAADELGRRFVRKVKAINKNGPSPSN